MILNKKQIKVAKAFISFIEDLIESNDIDKDFNFQKLNDRAKKICDDNKMKIDDDGKEVFWFMTYITKILTRNMLLENMVSIIVE